MKKHKYILGGIGLLSGLLTSYLTGNDSVLYEFSLYIPGIIFGLSLCIYFVLFHKKLAKTTNIVLLLISSIVAYVVANYVTYYVTVFSLFGSIFPAVALMAFSVGGFIGAAILVLGLRKIISLSNNQFLFLAVLGAFLSFGPYTEGAPQGEYLFLFIVWQTGMAFAIGWILDNKSAKLN